MLATREEDLAETADRPDPRLLSGKLYLLHSEAVRGTGLPTTDRHDVRRRRIALLMRQPERVAELVCQCQTPSAFGVQVDSMPRWARTTAGISGQNTPPAICP